MKLKLNITNKNIHEGRQSDPTRCAIAKAMHSKLGQDIRVGVFPDWVYLEIKKNNKIKKYKGNTTAKVTEFIKRFDAGLPVNPFKLSLNLSETKRILV